MKKIFNLQLLSEEEGSSAVNIQGVAEPDSAGRTEPDAGAGSEGRDISSEFDKAIEPYKDEYHSRMENAVQGRVRNFKSRIGAMEPIVRAVSERYGVDSTDSKALLEALNNDKSYVQSQAEENGVTEDVQLQLNQLRALNARNEAEEKRNALAKGIMETKEKFPEFDPDAELDNPEFMKLIKDGHSVEMAYKISHYDEIMERIKQYTVSETREKTINDIKSRGQRPDENGSSSRGSAKAQVDISKLSKKQIEEYIDKAKKGEVITFRE